jgi:hypothetical protein
MDRTSASSDLGPDSIVLEDDLLAGLDRFISHRDEPPRGRMSSNDAINVILRDWLMAQGYLDLPPDKNSITNALDAAKVPH